MTISAPTGPATAETSARRIVGIGGILTCGVVAIAAAAVLSLVVGVTWISPGDLVAALTGPGGEQVEGLLDGRIDRTIVGVLIGAAVAVSGAVMQGVTRNPLADPGILGVNSGAALAVILGIYLVGLDSLAAYMWVALLGGGLAAVLVYAIASMGPRAAQPVTMALTGAAVSAAATSIIAGLMFTSQETFDVFRFWQVGSVAGREPGALLPVLPLFALGFVLSLASGPVLNALALGDDLASALGQRVLLGRAATAFGAVCLAASSTAVAGPIGFVGLVVPHAVRLVVGPDYRKVLIASAVAGPVLVILADTVGRVLTPPSEVSVGIMTALIGVPVLVLLVRRDRVTS